MSLTQKVCLSAFLGVLSHLGIFIHDEHHLHSATVMNVYLVLFVMTYCAETLWVPDAFWKAQLNASIIVSTYGVALFCSILIYRLFFHSLRKFPGPNMAKVSKLWNVLKILHSTNFRLMEDMRQSYGDFVRTGKDRCFRLMLVLSYER